MRQRQVIKWYLAKRNWALAIQLAAEHLILLKQIANENSDVSIPYDTRDLKQKVWYGLIFTDKDNSFIDFESTYIMHEKLIDAVHKDWYMRPFKFFHDNVITKKYWQQYQTGLLDQAQQDAVDELFNKVGNRDELINLEFYVLQRKIGKGREKLKNAVLKLDVDSYRDIMTAIANGGNANYADLLRELSQYSKLVKDCAILKNAEAIGSDIREARNGMAHINGGTSSKLSKKCVSAYALLVKNCIPSQPRFYREVTEYAVGVVTPRDARGAGCRV